MTHTPKLTCTMLLSETVTICHCIHIFVKDAVACFQLDFNTYFHAPFEFFVSWCLALMPRDFTSLFACSHCLMVECVCDKIFLCFSFFLPHPNRSLLNWHWTFNNPSSSRIINFCVLAERFNTCTCTLCESGKGLAQWFYSYLICSPNQKASPVLNPLLRKQRSYYVFKWSPITGNFTVYLKAICFSLTLLWLGRASIVLCKNN